MPNLRAYTLKERQHFLAMSQQFEAEGITDGRIIRKHLQDSINEDSPRVAKFKTKRAMPQKVKTKKCPDCGSLMQWKNREGVAYYGCPKCYKVADVRYL